MSTLWRPLLMKRLRNIFWGALLPILFNPPARAGGGPENVALVVNADSWASLAVANEYVRLRNIPPGNVIYLNEIPEFDKVGVETFRGKILERALQTIEKRGLTPQIDYLVYSTDLPWAIDAQKDVGKQTLPQVITTTGSLTGLTYLYRDALKKDAAYLRLDANRYMRRPLPLREEQPLTDTQQTQFQIALQFYNDKKWAEAAGLLATLAQARPNDADILYNWACCLALQNKPEAAVEALQRAAKAGWRNHRHAAGDEDLKSLRAREDFKKILDEMRTGPLEVQPTRGFHNGLFWNEKGEAALKGETAAQDAAIARGGRQYLLSTMLGVTSGRGNSVREVLECLRRSAAADGTHPPGTVYFMVNGDVRSTTRDWLFTAAAAELKKLGVAAEVLNGVLPPGRDNVCGAMVGIADFDWKKSGSTIKPGAICEHLTSFGGMLRANAGQTPLTEFIRHGASGASGTVMEPYAIAAKFPTAFIQVHYARGCSLAEAFYQAVHGPYQLLIVGDPLCRPWATIPEVTLKGLEAGATVKGQLALKPGVNDERKTPIGRYELFIDGMRRTTCGAKENLSLDTTALADGDHELRIVAIAADAIETQGRVILPFHVNNTGRQLTMTPETLSAIALDQTFEVKAKLPGAKEIAVYHNGRTLGTIVGAEGAVKVNARQLGLGLARIYAIGRLDHAEVRGPSLAFEVTPPKALEPIKPAPVGSLQKGLQLTAEGKPAAVIEEVKDGNHEWLTKGGVEAGKSFELSGYFEIAEEDVYQFQLRTPLQLTLEIDGTKLDAAGGREWKFLPVALKPGLHKLSVRGKGGKANTLDLFFGGPGADRVDGTRFKHEAK